MRRRIVSSLFLLAFCPLSSARAEPEPSPFVVEPFTDGAIAGFGFVAWVVPFLVEQDMPGPRCDPCDPRELNALDRPVPHFDSHAADVGSDVMVAVVPALAVAGTFLSQPRWGWRGVAEDMTLIAESVFLTGVLQQIVRHAVRRPRPYMYEPGARPEQREEPTSGLSFYSGHTAAAFAAATSFAYTFTARRPGSGLNALVWIGAFLCASSVGVLRVAAGEHFWTDALVGAALGGGMGVLIPALHKRRGRPHAPRVVLSPSWVGVDGRF